MRFIINGNLFIVMRTLWVFGDSFSVDFENNKIENFAQYRNVKGYYPKTWGKILSEELNCSYRNHAQGGIDNHTILESFCDHIREIKPNDMVFVGWAPMGRMGVIDNNGKWRYLYPNSEHNPLFGLDEHTIKMLLVNRVDDTNFGARDILKNEIKSWENMIQHTMKDMKLHIWKWYDPKILLKEYQTISQETNVSDDHWSEKGHMDYAKDLLNIIK
jgi:hypothetical protein